MSDCDCCMSTAGLAPHAPRGCLRAEVGRLRRELNLLKAVHESAEAEVRQLLDENGPLIAVCREFIDRWPTEQGIDNTIQRARAILLDHDRRA